MRRPRGAVRLNRCCKTCGTGFWVYESTLRCSAASGNFCSRPCYHAWLRTPAARRPTTGRNWAKRAREAKAESPFCAICARPGAALEAHHLLPRRCEGTDDSSNLIVLCFPHHRMVEGLTRQITKACEEPPAEALGALITMLRFRQQASGAVLAHLGRA